jgi:hypothetical protein
VRDSTVPHPVGDVLQLLDADALTGVLGSKEKVLLEDPVMVL